LSGTNKNDDRKKINGRLKVAQEQGKACKFDVKRRNERGGGHMAANGKWWGEMAQRGRTLWESIKPG